MLLERRRFMGTIAGSLLAAPFAAGAQSTSGIARIGYLAVDPSPRQPEREAFLQGLRALGYVDGRNVVIEFRWAEGKPERLPALAAELTALKVDVIVAGGGTLGALAAKRATTTIPIVFPNVGDPVADGIVESLARPGGNATGLCSLFSQLIGKRLELVKQVAPRTSRVAFLLKPDSVPSASMKDMLSAADGAARTLGIQLQIVEARAPADFDRAFSDMSRAHADAMIAHSTPAFDVERRRLVGLAAKRRLPAVYSNGAYVEAGGLLSYATDFVDLFRRAATYVDKILKGARPADLPVEQPTKFELIINLKTAKALGLTIPPSLRARADCVIE